MFNKKMILILTIILVSLFAVSAVNAADNVTGDVVSMEETTDEVVSVEENRGIDNEVLCGVDNGTFTALQKKINNSEEGSTVTLENDYAYDEGFSTDGIIIDKKLTINGNGHTINGLSKSRIFNIDTVSYGTIVFENIKFCNANAETGGAICIESASSFGAGYLNITNCDFTNNNAGLGNAIYANSHLTMTNCNFVANGLSGKAVIARYYTRMTNCNFENDTGITVFSPNVGNGLTVVNCHFKNNTGSAVYSGDYLTIVHSIFDSNVCNGNGGAAYCGGTLNISDSTFTNNRASESGGAVYQNKGKVYITNSNFYDNQASENGGGVYLSGYKKTWRQGSESVTIYKTVVENSIFTGNVAGDKGGGIYAYSGKSGGKTYGAEVIMCTFSNNKASIDNDISGGNATDCVFKPNVVLDATDLDKYYGGPENFTVRITKDDMALSNANVKITVNGKTSTVIADSNGQASLSFNLPVGTYDVVTECEDVKFTSKATVKSTITASDVSGNYLNSKCMATFLDTAGNALASKQVAFKVGDKFYPATTNSNGVATANVDLGVGTYTVTAVNPVNNEQKQSKLVIAKANSAISLPSTLNKGATTLTATLTPASATGSVAFNLNGVNKNVPISNGKATLSLNDFQAGNYTVTASYAGDNNLNPSKSNTLTFIVEEAYPILTANDLSKTYGTGNGLVVNLADSRGNAIANAIVNVNINNKVIPIKTDANGKANMAIGQSPGTYYAKITYPGAKEVTAKIIVKKAKVKMTAKAKTFKKSIKTKKYTITLKNNLNKVMKNTKVTIKVNKKTYTAKTNKKGVATFKLKKLTKKGKYTATVTYKGSAYYNKLTKKVKITLK